MKKFTFIFLAMFFIVGASFAQNSERKWAIGLGPGLYQNLEKDELGFSAEAYLSRYLSPSFDLMLKPVMGFNNDGIDFGNPLLNLRYKFFNGNILSETSGVQPYLFAGPGFMFDNQESGVNFDAGVGSKFPLSQHVALYVEAAYLKGIDSKRHGESGLYEDVVDNHLQVSGIIEFALGKAKDSDGDGVPDRKDKCPDTPPGVQVDEKGCPVDSDGDGVPDYKDDCPNEAGSAQLNGCPDKDGDGIADKDDDCPDVPGLAKFNGCPDSDGDGVPDKNDDCPDTPKGCPVDANGCPLDSDGDGVIDCKDRCPNEVGPAENDGCPDWETLRIPDILFDFDRATLRAEGKSELDRLAGKLQSSKEYEIEVGGHADSTGPEGYNMKLSEKRAQSVVKYLLTKGVNNAYVSSNYYGEGNPKVNNNTRANRQLNRRVEFEKAKIRK